MKTEKFNRRTFIRTAGAAALAEIGRASCRERV